MNVFRGRMRSSALLHDWYRQKAELGSEAVSVDEAEGGEG